MPKDKIYHAKVSVGCEMRAVDTDDGTMRVSGYAMLFDNPTVLYSIGRQNIMECIDSAALDGCDMSDVVFDRGHAMEDKLLARTKNNTLTLSVDNKGLYFEAEIANTQEGRDTYELIKRGDLRGGVTYPQSTVKPVAKWVAEGATSEKQKKTVTGITFAYHKLRCAVSMTLEAETTSLAVFEQAIISNIAEAMIIGLEKGIVGGSATGQPQGIIKETVPADRVITVTKALTYADVVNAEAALPQAYEPNAKWVMTKKTFMTFVGQTDSAGQPIARVNYGTTGAPERYILGRPVICCDYLEALSASTAKDTVVAFLFDLRNYAINTNYKMGLKKYEDNETDDQVLKAILLADGKVIDNNGLVLVKAGVSA